METQPAQPTANPFRLVEDIPFAQAMNISGQLETLRLDIYLPEAPAATPPRTIVLFHGGGFSAGNDKRQFYIVSFARILAAAGFAVVSPDYRVRPKLEMHEDWSGAVRDAVEDGRKALEWVQCYGAAYGLDPTNLVLGGGSAGGMLVNNLVHDERQPLTPADAVHALLILWGPPMPNARIFRDINPHCPPVFIVHGTDDQLVPYNLSLAYLKELEAAGIPCQLMPIPGAPHTPVAFTEQITGQILAFLEKHEQRRSFGLQ